MKNAALVDSFVESFMCTSNQISESISLIPELDKTPQELENDIYLLHEKSLTLSTKLAQTRAKAEEYLGILAESSTFILSNKLKQKH